MNGYHERTIGIASDFHRAGLLGETPATPVGFMVPMIVGAAGEAQISTATRKERAKKLEGAGALAYND